MHPLPLPLSPADLPLYFDVGAANRPTLALRTLHRGRLLPIKEPSKERGRLPARCTGRRWPAQRLLRLVAAIVAVFSFRTRPGSERERARGNVNRL